MKVFCAWHEASVVIPYGCVDEEFCLVHLQSQIIDVYISIFAVFIDFWLLTRSFNVKTTCLAFCLMHVYMKTNYFRRSTWKAVRG